MHSHWIQQLEERRKVAVTTFWVSMALIIAVPLLLALEGDAYLILAMFCFGGAALRVYWTQEDKKDPIEMMISRREEEKRAGIASPVGMTKEAYAEAMASANPDLSLEQARELLDSQPVTHPEMLDENGNVLTPEYMQMENVQAEEFFSTEIDAGEPIHDDQPKPEYQSADDMQLADPATHPHTRFGNPHGRMPVRRSKNLSTQTEH